MEQNSLVTSLQLPYHSVTVPASPYYRRIFGYIYIQGFPLSGLLQATHISNYDCNSLPYPNRTRPVYSRGTCFGKQWGSLTVIWSDLKPELGGGMQVLILTLTCTITLYTVWQPRYHVWLLTSYFTNYSDPFANDRHRVLCSWTNWEKTASDLVKRIPSFVSTWLASFHFQFFATGTRSQFKNSTGIQGLSERTLVVNK